VNNPGMPGIYLRKGAEGKIQKQTEEKGKIHISISREE